MASQAKKCRRFPQQIVCHGPVRLVTIDAVLGCRWVLVNKRALLLRVATITNLVHGICLQVPLELAMRIVAVGADHLAFLDGMVRRKRAEGVDLRVASVANFGFLDGHRQSGGSADTRVTDVHE